MQVTRTQWPVGQGCFASGTIESTASRTINYVYDCGARNRRHLEPLVRGYTDQTAQIDALFVSHLDADHVDGLDILLARARVQTVYLPYLDIVDLLMKIVEAEDNGELTGSFAQATLNPAGWFGDRGVERVVLIRNGGGDAPDGFTPLTGEPDRPPEGPLYLKESGVSAELPMDRSTGSSETPLLQMTVGNALTVVSQFHTHWILVPYVPPVDPHRVSKFEAGICGILGVRDYAEVTVDLLSQKLRTRSGRRDLRNCYDAIIKNGATTNHNRISMSLYSGPTNPDFWECRTYWRRYWSRHWPGRGLGWIGTGDAKLNYLQDRSEWHNFYSRLLPTVGSLLLPHHGSIKNFHEDLLSPPNLELVIASADSKGAGYRHPSATVVHAVKRANKLLCHVSRKPKSGLLEQMWIKK